jgi:hypothetical protein
LSRRTKDGNMKAHEKERICRYGNCGLPLTRFTAKPIRLGYSSDHPSYIGHDVWVCPTGRHAMESGTI